LRSERNVAVMKKLGPLVKEVSANKIKEKLKNSNSLFVIKYCGLSSPDMSALRQSLKSINASLLVVRNSIARLALKEIGHQDLINTVEGPCGFVFVSDEPVIASKVLCDFLKDHEQLKLEAALLEDTILAESDIKGLAKIPSKEILRAQAVMGLKAPIIGVVMALNQILRKFVYCLNQIKDKKNN